MKRIIPLGFFVTGLVLVASVIIPIGGSLVRLTIFPPHQLLDPTLVSSYPAPVVVNVLGSATTDYSQAVNWFDTPVTLPYPAVSLVGFFTLSIPRLNLENIPVQVNGSDLKKNAIHYPGTALPGEWGNTVIFGHSALPQLYKPDNPLTIFNPLIKSKKGDDIFVSFDGMSYHYKVREIRELKPSHIEVLAQDLSRRQITLITCTPLGTYWYRFIVKADMVN